MIKLLRGHTEKALTGFQTWPSVGLKTYVLARKPQVQKVKRKGQERGRSALLWELPWDAKQSSAHRAGKASASMTTSCAQL